MRIAIYSRKSIETDTGESIQNQINMCKDYFNRQSTDSTFETFEDEGFSGGNINRPSFQRMLTLIKMKQFDVITVYKLDRIARNIVDFVNIYDELENYNVKLVSITEGFDPSTPIGKMMMLLLASFAEMERMNIAQRVKDNMKELAKMGRWSGGTPPTGYKVLNCIENEKKAVYLELIQDEGQIIKDIFEKYAQGYSSYEICKLLKNKGCNLNDNSIIEILKNPTYLKSSSETVKLLEGLGYKVYGTPNGYGFLPYNRRPRKKGVKSHNDKNKLVGVSKHEALIDFDLWMAVHNKLKEKSVAPHPRQSNFTFLSGGIVKCKCGASMEVCVGRKRQDNTRLYYFRCVNSCGNTSLRVDIGEEYVDNFIKELSDKDKLLSLINTVKPVKNAENEIKNINKKIAENNLAICNLIDKLMLMSNDGSKFVTNKIEQLSILNNQLKEQLLVFEREKLFKQLNYTNIDILYNQISYYIAAKNDITEKRRLVKSIIENVFWSAEESKISIKLVSP